MPRYTIQRARYYSIEIEAESGEEAVDKAHGIDYNNVGLGEGQWDTDWDEYYFFENNDDPSDEGEAEA